MNIISKKIFLKGGEDSSTEEIAVNIVINTAAEQVVLIKVFLK